MTDQVEPVSRPWRRFPALQRARADRCCAGDRHLARMARSPGRSHACCRGDQKSRRPRNLRHRAAAQRRLPLEQTFGLQESDRGLRRDRLCQPRHLRPHRRHPIEQRRRMSARSGTSGKSPSAQDHELLGSVHHRRRACQSSPPEPMVGLNRHQRAENRAQEHREKIRRRRGSTHQSVVGESIGIEARYASGHLSGSSTTDPSTRLIPPAQPVAGWRLRSGSESVRTRPPRWTKKTDIL